MSVSDGQPTVRTSDTAEGAPIKLLFVIYGLDLAGPELRLLEFARRFPPSVEMHVAVIGENMTMRAEFERAGARIIQLPMKRAYLAWPQLYRLSAYMRRHQLRIVSAFDLKTLIVAHAMRLLVPDVRIVHHLISLWDDIHGRTRQLFSWLVRGADQLICNGYAVRDVLLPEIGATCPVAVIPNGVDTDRYQPSAASRARIRDRLGIGPDDFVVGTVSNIRPVKNVEGLIRAFGAMSAAPRCWLVCVGGGGGLAAAKQVAQELPSAHRVIFTGPIADPAPYFAAFDIFSLPSLSEGNPNVVVQAMSSGVPVIASAVGEIPYLLDHGQCGMTVTPGDDDALSCALSLAESDPSRRHAWSVAASQSARHRYAMQTMITAYADLFGTLARPGR